jgi:endonuclease/exonuclease/phosphatase family metal-dependent hydrolase
MRIDHIFISPGLEVACIEIPNSDLARIASDHLPLLAEIRIPGRQPDPERANSPR